MAKRSVRRSMRHDKDSGGCIWGFINIFDFRRGGTAPKLISDRRRAKKHKDGNAFSRTKLLMLTDGEEIVQGAEDGKQSRVTKADAEKPSVKELMEVEMVNDENTYLGNENSDEVAERTPSNCPDMGVILYELCHQIYQKDTTCLTDDWHSDIHIQSNKNLSALEEKLSAAIQVFINQWLADDKHLVVDGRTPWSKELVDALQTLTTNKGSLMEFLQNSDSPLVRHIQEMRIEPERGRNSITSSASNLLKEDLNSSNSAEHDFPKSRKFFRRRSKSQESLPLTRNEPYEALNKIVILKPGPAGLQSLDNKLLQSDCAVENTTSHRSVSQFSLTEIKRKLKQAIGKDRHRNPQRKLDNAESPLGVGNGRLCSPNREHFYIEKYAGPSTRIKRREKAEGMRDSEARLAHKTIGCSLHRPSNVYIEARKHLSEMLTNGDRDAQLITGQSPETLGTILSLPEYNLSSSSSPGKDKENMALCPESKFYIVDANSGDLVQANPTVHCSPSTHGLESQPRSTNDFPDVNLDSPNTKSDDIYLLNHDGPQGEALVARSDEPGSKGTVDTATKVDTRNQHGEILDTLCETTNSPIINDNASIEVHDDPDADETFPCLSRTELIQLLSSPTASESSTSSTDEFGVLDCVMDRTDRPSPISVLEPLFTDNDVNPANNIKKPDEATTMQPIKIDFGEPEPFARDQRICGRTCIEDEESAFEYVEAVLLGSGLVWNEFLIRWISSCEVLDPTLFDEVELFSNRPSHDQKLLFDCTNEVLAEMWECYFYCFSGMPSNLRTNIQPVPKAMDLIQEVWKGVEWNLIQDTSSRSLDQLIRKDMAKLGGWIRSQSGREHIGIEMEEAILDELVEDTVLILLCDGMIDE